MSRNSTFHDYILEDKSKYKRASEEINPRTGSTYIDMDNDFLIGESGGFLFNIDFKFENTHRFSEVAQYYEDNGNYTEFSRGSVGYERFRVREETRRKFGHTLPCINRNGEIEMVHITGEHYNFLNYGRMRKLDESTIKAGSKAARKKEGFPRFFDSQYWYFKAKEFARNNGLHMVVGKSRRGGFSYMEGIDSANVVNLNRGGTVIHGAFMKDYVTKGRALSVMARMQLDFYEKETPFVRGSLDKSGISRGLLKKAIDELKLGFKWGDGTEGGYLSQIISVSFKDNPDAAIGKDAEEVKLEELSNFPNLFKVLDVTEPTTRTGAFTTGFIVGFGTGGSREGNWVQFETLFYNPAMYNFMGFENVWDKDSRNTVCGFFKAYWWGLEGFDIDGNFAVDDHGNSDYEVAMRISEKERAEYLANEKNSPSDYIIYCAQYANFPSESFSVGTESMFGSAELTSHITQVKHSATIFWRDGMYVREDSGLKFKTNAKLRSERIKIHDYIENVPFRQSDDVHGCVREFYPPYKVNGEVPSDLYMICYDPVGVDKDKTDITTKHSLNSFQVIMLPNNIANSTGNIVVASYAGRPNKMEDSDRILADACEYYNAKAIVETDRGETISNFKKWGILNRLYRDPTSVVEKGKQSSTAGFGMKIGSGDRADNGLIYIRDWLYTPVSSTEDGKTVYILHYIKDLPLLLELAKFNRIGNFDRLSSLRVGMFIIKQYAIYNKRRTRTSNDGKTLGQRIGLYGYGQN